MSGLDTYMDRVLPPEDIIPLFQAGLEVSFTAASATPPVKQQVVRRSQRVLDKARREVLPFFHFPIEIRNMIYSHLFNGYAFVFRHVNIRVGAASIIHGPGEMETQRGLPQWITMNKQFCVESLRQFHYQAEFSFFGSTFPPYQTAYASTSLLRLDRARNVNVMSDHPYELEWGKLEGEDGVYGYNFRLPPARKVKHHQTMNHLKCSGTANTPPTRVLQLLILLFTVSIPPNVELTAREFRTDELTMDILDQNPTDLHKVVGLQEIMIGLGFERRKQSEVYEGPKTAIEREL